MHQLRELLSLLADGRFHSGEVLGHALGVSRANVWLALRGLESYGLQVERLKGRGYRLARPLELLSTESLGAFLTPQTSAQLSNLELFLSLDSTNGYLMQRAAEGAACGSVCLAEHQTAGRGRRGRSWVSPLGRNLYLSLLWRFDEGPMRLAGLSLAVAVGVVEALEKSGIGGLTIKWPNDIFYHGSKVGGILLEVAGESSGPCYVVVGVGLNIDMPATAMAAVMQPWANLPREVSIPSRNELAAQLLNQLFTVMLDYPRHGLAPYHQRWRRYDLAADRQVDLHLHDRVISGVARGVDETGALLVEHDGRLASYASGEVSLRFTEPR